MISKTRALNFARINYEKRPLVAIDGDIALWVRCHQGTAIIVNNAEIKARL